MLYLKGFGFPSTKQETEFLYPKDKTPEEVANLTFKDYRARAYHGSVYPFNILSQRIDYLTFERVTFFCGGNGSGKTTALNIIAEKLGMNRDSLFNSGRFFQDYLNMCYYVGNPGSDEKTRRRMGKETGLYLPSDSRIIVSDDVFAYSMKQRSINDRIMGGTTDAEKEYEALAEKQVQLSLKNYEQWKARAEALKNRSAFIESRLGSEVPEQSNGETAMMYFLQRMENPGLYLLDEPENSLSLENQIQLAEYIESSVRWFDCQFIIATHSPIFLAMKGAKIYDFDKSTIKTKKWTEIENVKLLYAFFDTHREEFQ